MAVSIRGQDIPLEILSTIMIIADIENIICIFFLLEKYIPGSITIPFIDNIR